MLHPRTTDRVGIATCEYFAEHYMDESMEVGVAESSGEGGIGHCCYYSLLGHQHSSRM